MKRIGLFGGTFDPPHYGHLLMAEQVYQQLELDEIWFIPSYQPPHKANAKTTAADRLELTKRAIAGHPAFFVNPIEVERASTSYTLTTVRLLKEQYPEDTFYFIIGGDMVEYLPKWNEIDILLELVTFVGVNRPGHSLETNYPVKEVHMPLIDISSTMIRQRVQQRQSIRYLTPPEVIAFINKNGLYS
ncbi:nicotinate-nucleotide adenylyltransferase [Gracilibacillus alcaliphilus]|uniref:nicotinate-nucleotide adenylyltransferase n=1 Tax=Gracilibacillus alcaliphilus TaxID=1401441 RepID=UPI00195C9E08|nr:nicotinate-nucleotide adenylyltransferase [Gracilibacillus alcaliphilus]MBM7679407.1 nicotinate-nucleotide adenylyltransferase [Gracilibacillus alcaliphilus]